MLQTFAGIGPLRHIGFQNGRHLKSTYAIISGHNAAIDLILVSKYMFLRARNPMVPISTWYYLSQSVIQLYMEIF